MLLSAVLGAFFGTALLFIGNIPVSSVLIALFLPLAICFTAFGKRSLLAFGSLVFYFYISSVLLFGGTYAMISIIGLFISTSSFSGNALIIFLLICAVTLIYFLFSSLMAKGFNRKENLVKAELFDGVRTYSLELLVDSGNMAKDPFSQKAVAIVSEQALCRELVDAVCDTEKENTLYPNIRPRVIPIKTVSGTSLLYAFIPESMYIFTDGRKIKADCITAIDKNNGLFFGKDGIIPQNLLSTL